MCQLCEVICRVSVPLPGFSGLRPLSQKWPPLPRLVSVPLPGFSGLRLYTARTLLETPYLVSVPLPGFSGLRLLACFSFSEKDNGSFSPVAGIQWVETKLNGTPLVNNWCVSVPLPGFSGLRLPARGVRRSRAEWFQSRCRDSVG